MTSEEELAAALRSFDDTVELPAGDAVRVAKRGRRRQRARVATISGGLAVGLVIVGIGVTLNRTDGGTVIAAASSVPTVTLAESDELANAGVSSTVAAERSAAPLNETTTLNAVGMTQLVADQVVADDLCNSGDDSGPVSVKSDQVQVAQLPDGTTIANVTCMLGPYQPTSVALFLIVEETVVREPTIGETGDGERDSAGADWLKPIAVDWFDGEQISSQTFLYGSVDVVGGEADDLGLSVYVRYRGAGDCGMAMTHRWEPEESRGFVLETAHGVIECSDPVSETTPTDWPQLYPPPADAPPSGQPPKGDDETSLEVSPACDANELSRRADDLRTNPKVMTCLKQALKANIDATQFWIEDVIDDGDSTLVVWRASKFDGDFGLGTHWGHEEIHVTNLVTWSDKLVRRLDWEDPVNVDWMYAYRIEFVDPFTIEAMIGWHQGECYWVDRLDFDGNLVAYPGNAHPRPATLGELAADESLCVFRIEDEDTILAERFRSPEPLAYAD